MPGDQNESVGQIIARRCEAAQARPAEVLDLLLCSLHQSQLMAAVDHGFAKRGWIHRIYWGSAPGFVPGSAIDVRQLPPGDELRETLEEWCKARQAAEKAWENVPRKVEGMDPDSWINRNQPRQ